MHTHALKKASPVVKTDSRVPLRHETRKPQGYRSARARRVGTSAAAVEQMFGRDPLVTESSCFVEIDSVYHLCIIFSLFICENTS